MRKECYKTEGFHVLKDKIIGLGCLKKRWMSSDVTIWYRIDAHYITAKHMQRCCQ